MTTITKKAPYRFDQVGSFLRTPALKEALAAYRANEINEEKFLTIQHAEVKKLVDHQVAAGLKVVTDGEFSRSWWHLDFIWNLGGFEHYVHHDSTYNFHAADTRNDDAQLVSKVSYNPEHPFFKAFSYLASILPEGVEAKTTIPAPSLILRDGRSDRALEFYTTWQDYLDDLAKAYHDTIQHYYDLGARYVQLDDTSWAFLITKLNEFKDNPAERQQYEKLSEESIYVVNRALEGLPDDLRVTTHICRGNFQSTYLFEGGYAPVADYLAQLNYDEFFLEFDDSRSGDFEPIAAIWAKRPNVTLVLGLVTSKDPKLEDPASVKARIADAATRVPLENLALSTQCGFASTEEGNHLTEDEQWAKLRLIKQIADDVWE